jgi:hypothetical protein
LSGGAAVARLLDDNGPVLARVAQRLRRRPPFWVTTCAKYLIEKQIAAPTSAAALSGGPQCGAVRWADRLCLAISPSCCGPDLLRSVRAPWAAGADVLVMVNHPAPPAALG